MSIERPNLKLVSLFSYFLQQHRRCYLQPSASTQQVAVTLIRMSQELKLLAAAFMDNQLKTMPEMMNGCKQIISHCTHQCEADFQSELSHLFLECYSVTVNLNSVGISSALRRG